MVTIDTYARTASNAQIIANCLFGELSHDVQGINKAIEDGQKNGVRHPELVWPDCDETAWQCQSAIILLMRDLETLKNQTLDTDELAGRFFQAEAALRLVKAAAPVSAAYVGRCLDAAIKSASVFGTLVMDAISIKGTA